MVQRDSAGHTTFLGEGGEVEEIEREGRGRRARRKESRREWTAKIVRRVDIRTGGRGRRVRREESQEGGEQEGERGRRAGGRRAGWRGLGELRKAGGRVKSLSFNGLQTHGSKWSPRQIFSRKN